MVSKQARLAALCLNVGHAALDCNFCHSLAQEGEEILKSVGGAPDEDAATRGQAKKLDDLKNETEPEPAAKKAKLAKDSTMAVTAKVSLMTLVITVWCVEWFVDIVAVAVVSVETERASNDASPPTNASIHLSKVINWNRPCESAT
jgi:hypothetical protein